jgi:radical SAM-linked protein
MNEQPSFPVKIFFYKKKELVFISHLDLMRLFRRAIRRADLPIVYTHGFNPHIKLSFKRALAVGKKGVREEMIAYFAQKIDLIQMRRRFNAELPKGVGIKKMEYSDKELT